MPEATDQQMQQFANERIRVRAESLRALLAELKDDKAAIDDVYARAANGANPWSDDRADGPPKLLSSDDVLAYNSYITALIPHIESAADWPAVLSACVRPIQAS